MTEVIDDDAYMMSNNIADDEDELVVIDGKDVEKAVPQPANKPKRKKKKKVQVTPNPPWRLSLSDSTTKMNISQLIPNILVDTRSVLPRIEIQLQQLICSGVTTPINGLATLKVSISPLPGKQIALRSTSSSQTDNSDIFEFGKKSAILSMSEGDIRSKLYREGACPMIQVDAYIGDICASGSFCLSGVLQGKLQSLALSIRKTNLGCCENISLFFEIISEIPCSNEIASRGSAQVCVQGIGIVGTTVLVPPTTNLFMEISLSASNVKDEQSLKSTSTWSNGDGISLNSRQVSLASSWPIADVVIVRLLSSLDESTSSEVCRSIIPLSVLLTIEDYGMQSIACWQLGMDGMVYSLAPWSLICSMHVSSYQLPVLSCTAPSELTVAMPTPISSSDDSVGATDLLPPQPVAPNTPAVTLTTNAMLPITKTLMAIKTVSGQLSGFVGGYLQRSPSSRSIKSILPLDSANESVYAIVTVMPEGTKFRSSFMAPKYLTGNTSLESMVDLALPLSFPVQWTPLQRDVSFIKFAMYAVSNTSLKSSSSSNSSTAVGRLLGYACLDLMSLLQWQDSPATCVLGVKDSLEGLACGSHVPVGMAQAGIPSPGDDGPNPESGAVCNADGLCGWIVATFQFKLAETEVVDVKLLSDKCSTLSREIGLQASKFYQQFIPAPSVLAEVINVHCGLGPIHLNIPVANEGLSLGSQFMLLCTSNGCALSTTSVLAQRNNSLAWLSTDFIIPCNSYSQYATVLYLYLMKMDSVGGKSMVVAEATVVLSKQELDQGFPINCNIPLRANDGSRIAVVSWSMQLTTLANNITATSTEGLPALTTQAEGEITLLFSDGSIRDPAWKYPLEPFFECNLIAPSKDTLPSSCMQGRTGFIRSFSSILPDSNVQIGGLPTNEVKCVFKIPLLCPSTPTEEMVAPKWSIAIICRDAGRPGCPEVGWMRVGIPWALVSRYRSVDQWATIMSSQKASGPLANIGKIRLRMNLTNPDTLRPSSSKNILPGNCGVGSMVLIAHGVLENKPGQESDLSCMSVVTAAAFALPSRLQLLASNAQSNVDANDESADMYRFSESPLDKGSSCVTATICNSDAMVGILPICGSQCEVKLLVTTQSNRVPYQGTFNVLNTLRSSQVEDRFKMASLELPLVFDNNNDSSAKVTRNQSRIPKLQISAAFVPHVSGKFVITIKNLQMCSSVRLNDSCQRASIRICSNNSVFGFSDGFDLQMEGCSVEFEQRQVSLSMRIAEILDNFYEQEKNKLLVLHFHLLNISAALDGVDSSQQYLLGAASCATPSLVFQAVRAAASSNASSQASTLGVGTSSIVTTHLDFIDPTTKVKVALAEVDVQFVVDDIDPDIMSTIENSKAKVDPSEATSKARIELGLKQSFQTADIDSSGSITFDELLSTIKKARGKKYQKKAVTIGMEDPTALLLNLAGDAFKQQDTEGLQLDDLQLELIVKEIFKRLDLDGDGTVSWWEWKNVLSSSMRGRSDQSKFVDPLDVVAVGLLAAGDALAAQRDRNRIGNVTMNIPSSIPEFVEVSSHAASASGFMSSNRAFTDPVDINFDKVAPAKAVPRLLTMVKSLRNTNTSLSQRLESAVYAGQVGLDNPDLSSSIEVYKAEAGRASRQLKTVQDDLENVRKSLEMEHQKAKMLELRLSTSSPVALQLAVSPSRESMLNQAMALEMDQHKENLNKIKQRKDGKMRSMYILMKILRKWIKKFRKRQQELKISELTHKMNSMVIKKKYKETKKQRTDAASLIQSRSRGFVGRRKVQKMNDKATKIQKLFRGKLAREKYRTLQLSKVAAMFSKSFHAAMIIKRTFIAWYHRRFANKAQAALAIQSVLRSKNARKKVSIMKTESLKDKEFARKKQDAALAIQRKARARACQLNDKKLQMEEKIKQDQAKAAISIQSALRGKMDRSTAMMKKQEKLAAEAAMKEMEAISRMYAYAVENNTRVAKPRIGHCMGYWIVLNTARIRDNDDDEDDEASHLEVQMIEDQSQQESCEPNHHHVSLEDNYGLVTTVDSVRRILFVNYRDLQARSYVATREIPYDHPNLEWYQDKDTEDIDLYKEPSVKRSFCEDLDMCESGTRADIEIDDLHDNEMNEEAEEMEEEHREDHMNSSQHLGELNLISGGDSPRRQPLDVMSTITEGAPANASVNDKDSQLHKSISEASPSSSLDALSSYMSLDVIVIPKPDLQDVKLGVFVSYESENGAIRSGQIIDVIFDKRLISVIFDFPNDGRKKPELIPYDHPKLTWCQYETLQHVAGPSIVRPPLAHCIGCRVEVISREQDASPGDMFVGTVVSVHIPKQLVRIRFDVNSGSVTSGAHDDESMDEQSMAYLNPDIHWVSSPIVPSTVRPALKDAVGCRVEIRSTEPDAKPGDMFQGSVISVNEQHQTIRVRFAPDQDDASVCDEQELPHASDDIYWVTGRVVPSVARPPIESSIGWNVEVKSTESTAQTGDAFVGRIISFSLEKQSVRICYEIDNTTEIADEEDIPYDSDLIYWVNGGYKVKPILREAVGWKVEVRSSEHHARPGDMFIGSVIGIDIARNIVRIQFDLDEDGANDDDKDIQEFSYSSGDIYWKCLNASAAPVMMKQHSDRTVVKSSSTFRNRPAVDACVGYEISIPNDECASDPHLGLVTACNQKTRVITVNFYEEDGSLSPEDDCDQLPYTTPEITWIGLSTRPAPRPSPKDSQLPGHPVPSHAVVQPPTKLEHTLTTQLPINLEIAPTSNTGPSSTIALTDNITSAAVAVPLSEEINAATINLPEQGPAAQAATLCKKASTKSLKQWDTNCTKVPTSSPISPQAAVGLHFLLTVQELDQDVAEMRGVVVGVSSTSSKAVLVNFYENFGDDPNEIVLDNDLEELILKTPGICWFKD